MIFKLFVFFLPFTSVYIHIFKIWANNLSFLFFLVGFLILILKILLKNSLILDKKIKELLSLLLIIDIILYSITVFMGWYLILFVDIHYFPDNKLPNESFKLLIFVSIYLIILYVVINLNNLLKIQGFIRLSLISFSIVAIYGYVQIYTMFFQDSYLSNLYIDIENFIDKGWGGNNYKIFNGIPMSMVLFRINLVTPEPSEAGHYILTYIYPFLLSSLLTGYSVFNKKILTLKIETLLFLISLPLIIFTFSTATYFTFFVLLFFLFFIKIFLTQEKFKRKLTFVIWGVVFIFIFAYFYNKYYDYLILVFDKLSNLSNTSSHTRLFGMIGGLLLFLSYPFIGVGFGNIRYVFYDYIPKPLNMEQHMEYVTGVAFQPKSMFIVFLNSFGLIGIVLAAYFFYKIYKNIKIIKNINEFTNYLYYSFIFFILSFFMESFNSSSFTFVWLWTLIGFYISIINKKLYQR